LNKAIQKEQTPSANCKGLDDWTSMHYATEADNIEIMTILFENKANSDPKSQIERTPLHIACLRGSCDAA